MERSKIAGSVFGAVLVAAVSTACSTSSTPAAHTTITQTRAASSAQPANPVPILKEAGGVTAATLGEVDVYGDRYAEADIPGATIKGCLMSYSVSNGSKCQEMLEVYTYASAAAQNRAEEVNTPTDDHQMIIGHLFDVTVNGVSTDGNTWVFPVSVLSIAKRVGGVVQV